MDVEESIPPTECQPCYPFVCQGAPLTPPGNAKKGIEIGQALNRQKDRLPHGMFLPWIEAEFEMHEQSARRFMHVAETFAGKSNIVLGLNATALYELAAPSTPESVREAVEELIIDGEKVTAADRLESELADARKAQSYYQRATQILEDKDGGYQIGSKIGPSQINALEPSPIPAGPSLGI